MPKKLPPLILSDWEPSRNTLHRYAKIIGKIRGRYMPKSKHWWHITLSVSACGLTTTPFPVAGQNLEMTLDLVTHQLVMASSDGWGATLPLADQSAVGLCQQIRASLAAAGIDLDVDLLADFVGEQILPYEIDAIVRFRRVINWVDAAFKTFKGGLREETSPVQIFPHHMDVSMNWFSGRLVLGVDAADEESADEQLNFGFVTGDDSVAEAYFYVTAYPLPTQWQTLALPEGACWRSEGWTGAILPYAVVAASEQPLDLLLDYLRSLQAHGQALMS